VIAWFYRLLRNAVVDHYRHQAAKGRALDRVRREAPRVVDEEDLHRAVCQCVLRLLPTLKPEYSDLLRRVELDGESVASAAKALGITPNNAGVRLHRARAAMSKQLRRSCGACAKHGCLDCTCAPTTLRS
jgi:RNA polymerase sigma-70 factor (ECF subfamily)